MPLNEVNILQGLLWKSWKKYRGLCCSQISKQSVKPDISPLVSRLGGQVGHQKKQNSSRNWLLIVLCATFQPKLSKLSKTTQNGHFLALFWTFLKIVQFWLKSSARNQEKSIPWRISLLLMPHLTPKSRDYWSEINLGSKNPVCRRAKKSKNSGNGCSKNIDAKCW